MKKKILVMFGGRSTEHDVSVISAIEALYALPQSLYDVYPVYMRSGKFYGGKGLYTLKNYTPFVPQNHVELAMFGGTVYGKSAFGRLKPLFKPDCALLINHGGEGENGALQGFLEINDIPYASSGVFCSAIAMSKYALKLRLAASGVPVVNGMPVTSDYSEDTLSQLESAIGYPMFVKPDSQGSSIGVGVACDREELRARLALAFEYDSVALVEEYLSDFTELNVACVNFGGELLVSEPERPLSSTEVLTFEDKYIVGSKGSGMSGGKREFPANISDELKSEITSLTARIYTELGAFGVVRADYMLRNGKIYFNELNTIPGSLAHYLFPEKTYGEFLSLLIEEGIARGIKKEPRFVSSVLTQGVSKSGHRSEA